MKYAIHIAHITYDVLCLSSFHGFLKSWEVNKLLKVLLISMPLFRACVVHLEVHKINRLTKNSHLLFEGKVSFPQAISFVKIIAMIFHMILSSIIFPCACYVSSYLVLQRESVFFFLSYRKAFTNDIPRGEMEDNFIYDWSSFKSWKNKRDRGCDLISSGYYNLIIWNNTQNYQ